jgi:glycosyltransferase involved in cell wall biosynthesis
VLLLSYNIAVAQMAAVLDLAQVAKHYWIVFEPSTSHFIEPEFFLYLGCDAEVVVQCNIPADFNFFERLDLNLRPIALGAGDWVDFDMFQPAMASEKEFDIAMVASWARLKRHNVLFRALANLKPRRPRVALVGYPLFRTSGAIRREMRAFGVADQCTLFESVSATEVAKILATSKVALHLSRFEGANRSIYEAFFCNTPAIVYKNNVGFNMSHITPLTGLLADDSELGDAINWVLDHPDQFRPREWALSHTGYLQATGTLNSRLRELALARGEPWTRDIVPKTNRPNARYKHDIDSTTLENGYQYLAGCFIQN